MFIPTTTAITIIPITIAGMTIHTIRIMDTTPTHFGRGLAITPGTITITTITIHIRMADMADMAGRVAAMVAGVVDRLFPAVAARAVEAEPLTAGGGGNRGGFGMMTKRYGV